MSHDVPNLVKMIETVPLALAGPACHEVHGTSIEIAHKDPTSAPARCTNDVGAPSTGGKITLAVGFGFKYIFTGSWEHVNVLLP